jgi:DNA-binding FrmR family transcriptional regulator
MQVEQKTIADVTARLRRVEGQIGGIIRMIESERDCRDVVQQIVAASKALDQAGFKVLASGLRCCLRDEEAARQAGYSEEDLERLFLRLA